MTESLEQILKGSSRVFQKAGKIESAGEDDHQGHKTWNALGQQQALLSAGRFANSESTNQETLGGTSDEASRMMTWTRMMAPPLLSTMHKSREPRVSCLNPGKTSRDLLQHVSRPESPTVAREQ